MTSAPDSDAYSRQDGIARASRSLRAAGEVDGRWKAISIWESQEACDQFVQERVIPAVRKLFGEDVVAAGPPPTEWFEIKSLIGLDLTAVSTR